MLAEVITAKLREDSVPGPTHEGVVEALTLRVQGSACAAALSPFAGDDGLVDGNSFDTAQQAAEGCSDDRVRTEVALEIAKRSLDDGVLAETRATQIRRAAATVEVVAQPDLTAEIDLLRASIAERVGNLDKRSRTFAQRSQASRLGLASSGSWRRSCDRSRRGGSSIRARMSPMRWRWPPESCCG